MMNSKDLFRDLKKRITLVQEASETDSILYRVLETIPGITRSDVMAHKPVSLTADELAKLDSIIYRLNQSEPVQYILGKTEFYGREFRVNNSVLIPRPETELLVEEVVKHATQTSGTILDIGTGSGCIAITLAKELPHKNVVAYDISDAALQTAIANAKQLQAPVSFKKVDVLRDDILTSNLEVIVSNPPYVALSEKETMHANVLQYEPHVALFVADSDPLIFYREIAKKGWPVLIPGGRLVVEINERFGEEVCDVFRAVGFREVHVIKDFQGKDRIVSAVK